MFWVVNDEAPGVPVGADVAFPNTGATSGNITKDATSTIFTVPITGAYEISWTLCIQDATAQTSLFVNGALAPETVVERDAVFAELTNHVELQLTAGDTVEVRNTGTSPFVLLGNGTSNITFELLCASTGALPGSINTWGAGDVGTTMTARFLSPGYDRTSIAMVAEIAFDAPRAGTARNMFVHVLDPSTPGAQTLTYTLFVNGVATALLVTMNRAATDAMNTTDTVSFNQGDRLAVQVTKSAVVSPGINNVVVSMEL